MLETRNNSYTKPLANILVLINYFRAFTKFCIYLLPTTTLELKLNLKKYYARFFHSYGTLRTKFGLPNFSLLIRKYCNPQLLADKRNFKTSGWTVRNLINRNLVAYINRFWCHKTQLQNKTYSRCGKNGRIIQIFFWIFKYK